MFVPRANSIYYTIKQDIPLLSTCKLIKNSFLNTGFINMS